MSKPIYRFLIRNPEIKPSETKRTKKQVIKGEARRRLAERLEMQQLENELSNY